MCVCVCFFQEMGANLFGRACDGVLGGKQVALTSVPNMRSGKSK